MKRVALLLAFLGLGVLARADQQTYNFNSFGGLDTESPDAAMQPNSTPDAENGVTDLGPGLRPRDGFVLCQASSATAQWVFPLSNGTRYQIIQSGGRLLADTGGCTFAVTVSTVDAAVNTAAAVLGDKFFFMDTTNGLKYWDGVNVAVASATLKGSQLVNYKGRLWASALTADPRSVRASAFNDGTTWALAVDPLVTDPAVFVIGGQVDEPMTALYATHLGSLTWMKSKSFGAITGNSRADFVVRSYSDNVGTSYPDSIRDCDGLLRWLGPSRTIYEWDGSKLQNIGRSIQTYLGQIGQGDANARTYTVTSGADYGTGTSFQASTTTSVGDVTIAMANLNMVNNSFEVGSGTTTTGWTTSGAQRVTTGCGTPPNGSYYMRINGASIPGAYLAYAQFSPGFAASQISPVGTCPTFTSVVVPSVFGGSSIGDIVGAGFESINLPSAANSAYSTQRFYDGIITVSVATDGTYWYVDNPTGGYTNYSSGTWTSPGISVATVISTASWGLFTADSTLNSGAITYSIYTSSNSSLTFSGGVPVASSWSSSQTITSGAFPTVSTNTYAYLSESLSVVAATVTYPVNHSLALAWTEGNNTKVPSAWFRQRYWLGVSFNSTTNNKVLVFDRNRQWQRYSGINAAALGLYNGSLFFGNSAGVYQYEVGNMDAGSAIAAYYRTPTFSPSSPNIASTFLDMRVTAQNSAETLVTTYRVNDVATDYSFGTYAMNTKSGLQNFNLPFPITQIDRGNNINFNLAVSGTTAWRILGFTLTYVPDRIPLD